MPRQTFTQTIDVTQIRMLRHQYLTLLFLLCLQTQNVASLSAPGKPVITSFPAKPIHGTGQMAVVTSSGGDPDPTLTWLRDGVSISGEGSSFTNNQIAELATSQYLFTADRKYLKSVYTVRAQNSQGTTTSDDARFEDIFVVGSAPVLTGPNSVPEGTAYTYSCRVENSNPKPKIKWSLGGTALTSTDEDVDDTDGVFNVTAKYTFTPTKADHKKVLTCIVEASTELKTSEQETSMTLDIQYKPDVPTMSNFPDSPGIAGTTHTLKCAITEGNPAPSFSWYRNGVVRTDNVVNEVSQSTWRYTLQTNDARVVFKCTAKNVAGENSAENSLEKVYVEPGQPSISGVPANPVIEGNEVTLTCSSTGGNPVPTVQWYRGTGSTLVDSEYQVDTVKGEVTNEYKFTVHHDDKNVAYKCIAKNDVTEKSATATISEVFVSPSVPSADGPTVLYEDKQDIWYCNSTRAYRKQTVGWYLDDKADDRLKLTTDEKESSVGIFSVYQTMKFTPTPSDSGSSLQCYVTHHTLTQPRLSQKFDLTVHAKPGVSITPTTDNAENGRDYTITCAVNSSITYSVTWYKSTSNKLTASTKYVMGLNTLTIKNFQVSDNGAYTCIGENLAGKSAAQNNAITLTAFAYPGTPSIKVFPDTVIEDIATKVVCESAGGIPSPTVIWYGDTTKKDETSITVNDGTVNSVTTNEYQFVPVFSDKDVTFKCVVTNGFGSPLEVSKKFNDVYVTPDSPVMDTKSIVYEDNTETYTCNTTDGFPQPVIHWRIGNTDITSKSESRPEKESRGTYSVYSVLTYAPTSDDVGKTLYCEVRQEETITGALSVSVALTVYLKPVVSVKNGPYTVLIGTNQPLECIVTSILPTTVNWYRDTSSIALSGSKYVIGSNRITINTVQTTDDGLYFCQASNRAGSSPPSNKVQLIAYAFAGIPVLSGFPDIVLVELSYTVTCTSMNAVPAPNVTWYRDDVMVDASWETVDMTTKNSYTFTADFKDKSVNFTCIAQNAYGFFSSSKSIIAEYVTPILQTINGPSIVYESKPSSWWCNATRGFPRAALSWFIGTKNITDKSERTDVINDDGTIDVYLYLTLTPTTEDVGKSLNCVMEQSTLVTSVKESLHLTVHLIATVSVPVTEEHVEIGKATNITCIVVSSTFYRVDWFKDNVQLNSSGSNYTTVNDSIIIHEMTVYLDGGYTCQATNLAGTSNHSKVARIVAFEYAGKPFFEQYPKTSIEGEEVVLICKSSGGRPAPKISLYKNGILQESVSSTYGEVVKSSYTMVSLFSDRHSVYLCFAGNVYGNFSTERQFENIYVRPSDPVITGSNVIYEGKQGTWKCSITRAYPKATITWRLNDTAISSATQVDTANSVTAELTDSTSTVTYTPVKTDVGKVLYCDVAHTTGKKEGTKPLTVYLIPTLSINPRTVEVETTKSYTITCSVVSILSYTVTWYKDGTKIPDNAAKYEAKTNTLTIKNVEKSDDASYTCTATNAADTSTLSNSIQVKVYTKTVTPTLKNFPQSGVEGEDLSLICTTSVGIPPPKLHWFINDILVDEEYSTDENGLITNILTVKADFAKREDNYKCKSINDYGTTEIEDRLQAIYVSPASPQWNAEAVVYESVPVTWYCYVSRVYPVATVKWRIGDKILTPSAPTISDNDDKTYSMNSSIVHTPTQDDVGKTVYCEVEHASLDTTKSVVSQALTVYKIPTASISKSVTHEEIDKDFSVECKVTSEIAFTAKWYKGSTALVSDNKKYQISQTTTSSTLRIISVQVADDATYFCTATNKAGTGQSTTIRIVAYQFPGEPTISGFLTTPVHGRTLELTCRSAGGVPTPTVKWFKDDNLLGDSTVTGEAGVVAKKISFAVDVGDRNSLYECQAKNIYKTRTIKKKFSDVYVQPVLLAITPQGNAYESVESSWWGTVSPSNPEPSVFWRLGSVDLTSKSNIVKVDNSNGTISLSSRLDYTPKKEDKGKTLYFEVQHDETLSSRLQKSFTIEFYLLPTVVININSKDVEIGTTTTITNTITSEIVYTVTWYKDDSKITIDNSKYKLSDYNLIISNFLVSDDGEYKCTATNAAGTSAKSNAVNLNAYSIPLIPNIYLVPTTTIEGTRMSWNCTCKEGIPPPNLFWLRDGVKTDETYSSTVVKSSSFSFNDIAFDIAYSDKGVKYRCEASNKFTTTPVYAETSVNTIYVNPTDTSSLTGVSEVHEDKTYTYVCEIKRSEPAAEVTWFVGTTSHDATRQSTLTNTDGTKHKSSELEYAPKEADHGKEVKCSIKHDETLSSPLVKTITLRVTLKPRVTIEPTTANIEVGKNVQLKCVVVSTPTFTVKWYKEGSANSLIAGSKYSIAGTTLTIQSLTLSDAGKFYCEATSAAGTSDNNPRSEIKTYINGLPSLSGIPEATIENTVLIFNCTCTGGTPTPTLQILRDGVEVAPGKTTEGSEGTTVWKAYTFSVLTRDRGVEFKCIASNTFTALSVTGSVTSVYVPPTGGELLGPIIVVAGKSTTWSCHIKRVSPPPEITWFNGDDEQKESIQNNYYQTGDNGIVSFTSNVTFIPKKEDNGKEIKCVVKHTLTKTDLDYKKQITVHYSPNEPVISGFNPISIDGTEMTIVCKVADGNPRPTVTWFRDDTEVDKEDTPLDDNSVVNEYKFTVLFKDKDDVFKCVGKNSEFVVLKEVTFTDINVTPNGHSLDGPSDLLDGREYTWNCSIAQSYPVPTFEWTLENRPFNVLTLPTLRSDKTYSATSKLTLTAAGVDTGKTLSCIMTHAQTSTKNTEKMVITVHVKPNVSVTPTELDVVVGEDATFTCHVTSTKPASTIWHKKGVTDVIKDDNDDYDIDGNKLTIKKITEDDEGEYYCFAESVVGKSTQSNSGVLEGISAPENVVINNFQRDVEEGTVMDIECRTDAGDPLPEVKFYKNDQLIDDSFFRETKNGVVTTINKHSLTALFADRAAVFKCTATNKVKTIQATKTYSSVYVEPYNLTFTGPKETTENIATEWSCTVPKVSPPGTIKWFLADTEIVSGKSQTLNTNTGGTLQIHSKLTKSLVALDNFKYLSCRLSHPETSSNLISQENITVISTFSTPVIAGFPASNIGVDATTLSLTCSTNGGYPFPTLTVYKDGAAITGVSRETKKDGNGVLLSQLMWDIAVTRSEIKVQYTCKAKSTKYELEAKKMFTDVYVKPVDIVTVNPSGDLLENRYYNWTCKTSRVYPEATFTWTLDSTPVTPFGPTKVENDDGSFSMESVLQLKVTGTNNEKILKCTIQHSETSTTKNKPVTLVVHVKPTVSIDETKKDIVFPKGGSLVCNVVSSIPETVKWYRQTKAGEFQQIQASERILLAGKALSFSSVETSDDGNYVCEATNAAGTSAKSNAAKLTVYTQPSATVAINATSPTLEESGLINVTCAATVNPPNNVVYTWYHMPDNKVVANQANLLIKNAKRNQAGTYKCVASNTYGRSEASFKVDIQFIPESAVTATSFRQTVGTQLVLSCDTLANPEPTKFDWFMANVQIPSTPTKRKEISVQSDVVEYKCYATNSVGKSAAITFVVSGTDDSSSDPNAGQSTADEESGISSLLIAIIVLSCIFAVLIIFVSVYCIISQQKKKPKSSVEPMGDEKPFKFDPNFHSRKFVEQYPPPPVWHTPRRTQRYPQELGDSWRHHGQRTPRDPSSTLRMEESIVTRGDVSFDYPIRKPKIDQFSYSLRAPMGSERGTIIDTYPDQQGYPETPRQGGRLSPLTFAHDEKLRKKWRKSKKKVKKRRHQPRESGEGMESPEKSQINADNSTKNLISLDDEDQVEVHPGPEINLAPIVYK